MRKDDVDRVLEIVMPPTPFSEFIRPPVPIIHVSVLSATTKWIGLEWGGMQSALPPSTCALIIGLLLGQGQRDHLVSLDSMCRLGAKPRDIRRYLATHGLVEFQ